MKPKFPCDLHVHSNWSDGDYPPTRVFREAKRAGLKGIVLTEHDVTKGLGGTYRRLANKFSLQTLEGVEISTKYKRMEVHIIGYSNNFNLAVLNSGLHETLEGMKERAETMLAKLRGSGATKLKYEDIARTLPNGLVVVKYHISTAIAKERNIPLGEARELMHGGGAAYVPVGTAAWAMSPAKAITLIHNAGGIATLAHPGNYRGFNDLPNNKLEELIEKLIPNLAHHGLDALEVRSAKHTPKQLQHYRKLAKQYKLLETGGSDWHGFVKSPDRYLGDGGVTMNEFKLITRQIQKRVAERG
ncbi:MAG: PHP domain-containing protein [Patescibacteria group bacterium]